MRSIVRYGVALFLLLYGFAKINGSQFTILDSELDKPAGMVSGFWLTWYYFGFSPFYGNFLALVEIVGALLLTFRRTTLLGACMLAAVMGNIVMIDICYGVDASGTLAAIVLFGATLYLLAPHAKELIAFFLPKTEGAAGGKAWGMSRWAVRGAMVALTCGFTYWVANFNNRDPTPLDGTWDVVRVEPANFAPALPVTLFFEHNRAHMAVFKSAGGEYKQHHFEVDPVQHKIRSAQNWLTKGPEIFDGTYMLAGNELTVDADWQGVGKVVLEMRGRRVR